MKHQRWLRLLGIALGAPAALAALAVATGLLLAEWRVHRRVDVPVHAVAYRDEATVLERGRYLYASRGCADCHGGNGGGRTFAQGGGLTLAGPDITPAGVAGAYQPVDWVRTIRHGVTPQGRALMMMPSEDYNGFTDDDLAAIVAYLRSLPPQSGRTAIVELPLPMKAMYGFGAIPDAASRIDHAKPPRQAVPEGVTLRHGEYVASMCVGCHGVGLVGGKIRGGAPDWPPAARLAAGEGSVMDHYPDADSLIAMFRSGKRPDGSVVQVMPFDSLAQMSETDVRALHLYLTAR
ncbi:MAG: cytochrome c [Alcaligenaceae bacterium]|nr:cytochrome c [Alcaligenaceae bacterium SAGV5]MPS51899.1 cytochrome c [Alcaligenaceae bacterium SAGV3]MPT57149.1 cytochrome c [Alcaligenaceae bacterium]